jgi:signal transduction histidine kinase
MVAVAVVCAVFILGAGLARHAGVGPWWSDLWWVGVSAVAAVAALRAARLATLSRMRQAWRWIAAACGVWCGGAIWWAVAELGLGQVTPFPSIGDALFLALVPFMVAAGWQLRRVHGVHRYPLGLTADVGMMSAGALLPTIVMLQDAMRRTHEHGPFVAIAVVYTVTSTATFMILLLWTLGAGAAARGSALAWLTAASAALALANLLYAYQLLTHDYLSGGAVDVLWVLPFACVAAAALTTRGHAVESERPALPSRVDAFAPAGIVSVCIVLALLFAEPWHTTTRVLVLLASLAMSVFIGVRALASLRIERALAAEAARRRDHERALDAQLATIAQHHAISTLASSIAHDFNNLLQAMTGQLALARRRAGRGDDPLGAIDDADRALARASELSARLLELGRRGRSGGATTPSVTDAHAHAERAAASVRPLLGDRGDIAVAPAPPAPAWVRVASNDLDVALLNLLLNARDAVTVRGGHIDVRVTIVGDRVRVEVVDDGPGMPAELRARAAEPYVTTKPPGQGAGLGLTYVSSFASRHDGALRLDAAPTGGTLATLELPLADGMTATQPATAPAAPPIAGRQLPAAGRQPRRRSGAGGGARARRARRHPRADGRRGGGGGGLGRTARGRRLRRGQLRSRRQPVAAPARPQRRVRARAHRLRDRDPGRGPRARQARHRARRGRAAGGPAPRGGLMRAPTATLARRGRRRRASPSRRRRRR